MNKSNKENWKQWEFMQNAQVQRNYPIALNQVKNKIPTWLSVFHCMETFEAYQVPSLKNIACAKLVDSEKYKTLTPEEEHIFKIAGKETIQLVCEDHYRNNFGYPLHTYSYRLDYITANRVHKYTWKEFIQAAFPYAPKTRINKNLLNTYAASERRHSVKRRLFGDTVDSKPKHIKAKQ